MKKATTSKKEISLPFTLAKKLHVCISEEFSPSFINDIKSSLTKNGLIISLSSDKQIRIDINQDDKEELSKEECNDLSKFLNKELKNIGSSKLQLNRTGEFLFFIKIDTREVFFNNKLDVM